MTWCCDDVIMFIWPDPVFTWPNLPNIHPTQSDLLFFSLCSAHLLGTAVSVDVDLMDLGCVHSDPDE